MNEPQMRDPKTVKYEINGELMTGIADYLVRRPYAEVFRLLEALRQVPALDVTATEVEVVDEVASKK